MQSMALEEPNFRFARQPPTIVNWVLPSSIVARQPEPFAEQLHVTDGRVEERE